MNQAVSGRKDLSPEEKACPEHLRRTEKIGKRGISSNSVRVPPLNGAEAPNERREASEEGEVVKTVRGTRGG